MASTVNFTLSDTINFCCSKFWVLFWGAGDIHLSFQTLLLELVDADIPHDWSKALPDIWMQQCSASLLSSLETCSSGVYVSWFFPSLPRLLIHTAFARSLQVFVHLLFHLCCGWSLSVMKSQLHSKFFCYRNHVSPYSKMWVDVGCRVQGLCFSISTCSRQLA